MICYIIICCSNLDRVGDGDQVIRSTFCNRCIENVYRDTLDSSLRLGIDALRMLNVRAYHAFRSARTFRRHDEESVRDLATMRHDRKTYIHTARQRISDLEELLLSDLDGRDELLSQCDARVSVAVLHAGSSRA